MDQSSITRRNHYVPQFYLRNWSDDRNTVYTYNLLVSDSKVPYWRQESIRNVAVWNDFYTRRVGQREIDDFEKWFDYEFESPARPVFDKLLIGENLNYDESIILSHFVAAQHARTPARLNELLALGRKEMPTVFEDILEEISREHANGNYKKDQRHISVEDKLLPVKVSLDREHGVAQVNSIVGKGMYLFALKHLLTNTLKVMEHHQWHIIHAAEGVLFPTSDDPVICLNYNGIHNYDFNGGWGLKNGSIIMPISPKQLLFTQIGDKSSYDQLSNSLYWSKLFRKMIIEHAHRHVYADKPQKGMLAINPRVVNRLLYEKERETMSGWHEEQTRAESELLF